MTLDCTVLSTNADRDTVLENKQQATLVHEVVPFFAIQCCMYVNAFCGQKNLPLVTKSTKSWTICLKTLLTTCQADQWDFVHEAILVGFLSILGYK